MSTNTSAQSPLWEAEPHTLAKHAILKKYLDAWAVIFSRTLNVTELLFYDGFAGPGEYAGGELGSPIVALNALLGSQGFLPLVGKHDRLQPWMPDRRRVLQRDVIEYACERNEEDRQHETAHRPVPPVEGEGARSRRGA